MILAGGSAAEQFSQVACLNRADTCIPGAEGRCCCEAGCKPVAAAGEGFGVFSSARFLCLFCQSWGAGDTVGRAQDISRN